MGVGRVRVFCRVFVRLSHCPPVLPMTQHEIAWYLRALKAVRRLLGIPETSILDEEWDKPRQQKDEWTSEQKAVLDRRYGPNYPSLFCISFYPTRPELTEGRDCVSYTFRVPDIFRRTLLAVRHFRRAATCRRRRYE